MRTRRILRALWGVAFGASFLGTGAARAEAPSRDVASAAEDETLPDGGATRDPDALHVGEFTLRPTLSLRTRGEYRRDPPEAGGVLGGAPFAGQVPRPIVRDAGGVSERVRVGLSAERGPLALHLSLQDARVWAPARASGSFSGSGGSFGLYEAYIDAHGEGHDPSFLHIGRQAIDWGDGTLLSSADWAPTGRALDAIRGRLACHDFRFELLGAFLEGPSPYGLSTSDLAGPPSFGTQLYGALARYAPHPLFGAELMSLVRVSRSDAPTDGSQFSSVRNSGELVTLSARLFGADSTFRYSAMGAYQFGRVGATDGRIAAWMANGSVSKTFDAVYWDPTLNVGGALASGSDGGSVYRQFDPLLPDVHRAHGLSDLFATSNVADVHGGITLHPTDEMGLDVTYRYLRFFESQGEWISAYTTTIGSGATSTELGHEIDLSFHVRVWKKLELDAQYALLALGDGAKAAMARMGRTTSNVVQGTLGVVPQASLPTADIAQVGILQATLRVP